MSGVVDFRQVLEVQVGVYLGGTDVGMTEQFLDRPQITGGFQHVAGKSVA